jgi:hypothetical protein
MANTEVCIAECMECHRVCMETLTHSLRQGQAYVEADHVQLLLDCSQICQTAVDFMTRGSDAVCQICEITAYICEKAAVSCARWADTDPKMKRCADVCKRCAECCRRIMMAA